MTDDHDCFLVAARDGNRAAVQALADRFAHRQLRRGGFLVGMRVWHDQWADLLDFVRDKPALAYLVRQDGNGNKVGLVGDIPVFAFAREAS